MSKKSHAPKPQLSHYLFEFLTVFAGIMLAFALNTWNEARKENHAETKILTEIKNGLQLDITDIQDNVFGHERGIEACQYFRDLANGLPVPDSLANGALFALLRDYISIQNQSGYESLKSRGLELISNDSLRLAIIHMYEFEHQALSKLEENYTENQFFENYFHPINEVLGPFMTFDSEGKLSGFSQPVFLSDTDRNQLLIYLDKIEFNRRFMLQFYARNREKAEKLIRQIEEELE